MNLKSIREKDKARKKVDRCIACRKSCSMSGLCMMPWPEFKVDVKRKQINDYQNIKKNR